MLKCDKSSHKATNLNDIKVFFKKNVIALIKKRIRHEMRCIVPILYQQILLKSITKIVRCY